MFHLWKTLGRVPGRAERKAFRELDYFEDPCFNNLYHVDISVRKKTLVKAAFRMLFRRPDRPKVCLPVVKTDLKALARGNETTVVWLGHSSVFLASPSATILMDPVLSDYSSPFPGAFQAFAGTSLYGGDDFPAIDLLLISHDHYDHLDFDTVVALKNRVEKVIVPLGVRSHFCSWGFDPKKVFEMGWDHHERIQVGEGIVDLTATTALHWSGRSLWSKRTLWCSYVIELDGKKIFFGGDGGYGVHFSDIGQRFGPFDLVCLENGQYNVRWPKQHMFPEQTYQAARDLRAKVLLPIHWGRFSLSDHAWNQPILNLLQCEQEIPIVTPKIGEPYVVGEPVMTDRWMSSVGLPA